VSEFVTEAQCKERRDSCQKGCADARDSRDAWIEKLEKKIDNLIYLAIGQLCALVLTLLGVIILK
jgi:hypothetical protein